MSEHNEQQWQSFPRVRLVAQPLSLGIILLAIGGWFGWHMLAAYDFSEPWWLQAGNLFLILGFGSLFLWGITNMLSLFQRVWIRKGEVQLRMFGKMELYSGSGRTSRLGTFPLLGTLLPSFLKNYRNHRYSSCLVHDV